MRVDEKISYKNFINDIEIYLNQKLPQEIKRMIYGLLSRLEEGSLCLDLFNQDILNTIHKIKSPEFDEIFVLYKDRYFYFRKHFEFQKFIKERLNLLINRNTDQSLLKEKQDEILDYLKKLINKLNKKQLLSILLGMENYFLVISGGPGTGKTTVASYLIGIYLHLFPDHRIGISAPTGRASARLFESIRENLKEILSDEEIQKIEPMTLHRLLGFQPYQNEFLYNEENLLDYKLILVDEVSMLDLNLMKSLFSAIPYEGDVPRIIFLGDVNQLPSVSEGNILSDLIPEPESSFIKKNIFRYQEILSIYQEKLKIELILEFTNPFFILLTESYRNKKHIKEFSDRIINYKNDMDFYQIQSLLQRVDEPVSENPDKILWMDQGNLGKLKNLLKNFIKKNIEKIDKDINSLQKMDKNEWMENKNILNKVYNCLTQIKILCIIKEGMWGVQQINKHIIDELYKGIFPSSGIPFIITHNDYLNHLFNGDIGIFLKDNKNQYWGCFKNKDQFMFYPLNVLQFYEPSFAITIHKSQGSEYNNVMIILPPEKKVTSEIEQLLTRQILYTAVTRAKENVYLYAEEKVLKKTIANQIKRESGLKFFEE